MNAIFNDSHSFIRDVIIRPLTRHPHTCSDSHAYSCCIPTYNGTWFYSITSHWDMLAISDHGSLSPSDISDHGSLFVTLRNKKTTNHVLKWIRASMNGERCIHGAPYGSTQQHSISPESSRVRYQNIRPLPPLLYNILI